MIEYYADNRNVSKGTFKFEAGELIELEWDGLAKTFSIDNLSTGEVYLLSNHEPRFYVDVEFNADAEIYFAVSLNNSMFEIC